MDFRAVEIMLENNLLLKELVGEVRAAKEDAAPEKPKK